jgi:hypothetical protein
MNLEKVKQEVEKQEQEQEQEQEVKQTRRVQVKKKRIPSAQEQEVCVDGKESKEERFKRLAEARVNKLLKSIRLLGNLSNKNNYAYTDDDIIEMLGKIRTEIGVTKKKFFS